MQLISAALVSINASLPEIAVRVDRRKLAKRRWRETADDGMEFGCELAAPIRDGDTIWQTASTRYVIRQPAEAVVEVSLEVAPSAAAGIGWAVGNMHLELAADANRLLAPDEPAVRQLLERLQVPYRPAAAVFRPGRFVRGNQPTHDLGPSHKH